MGKDCRATEQDCPNCRPLGIDRKLRLRSARDRDCRICKHTSTKKDSTKATHTQTNNQQVEQGTTHQTGQIDRGKMKEYAVIRVLQINVPHRV